ncbi:MAG: acetyl-CoA carboxylase carboxyltransferase subunit beta [Bacteroidia bacterium]|nr:acetyl-CoA carboxylase carboxyltransferase subunit beta [Bacteroidia bacterium]
MSWFKRVKEGILTRTEDKKETPDGMWYKCEECKQATPTRALEENCWVCPHCEYHKQIGSYEYFQLLFDGHEWRELDRDLISGNPLNFTDTKDYVSRIKATREKTNLNDAIRVAFGEVEGEELVVACMDFKFIGGSMGSVMGEKISRAIDFSLKYSVPLLVISKSGGARMMEGALSLMQMAKISAKLNLLSQQKIPYFSLMTDPTTGGVTASFAMLGDLNFAEPNALIGFAGPRVIKETIGKDLPEGFQRAEFLLEHGFLDFIVPRGELKAKLASLIRLFEK